MSLSRYHRTSYRLFGSTVARAAQNDALRQGLLRAQIRQRPEVYLAVTYTNMLIAFAACAAVTGVFSMLWLSGALPLPGVLFAFLLPFPVVVAGVIYMLAFVMPGMRAGQRAKAIDAKLPAALNYIATMASSGVTPQRVFSSLADQPIYGEVANEAAMLTRDLEVLGKDLVSGLSAAIERSPSVRWQDLLQGAITAITSGEDLKGYFLSKNMQFAQENRQEQKRFLDNLAILAESFVTVVVAAPLLLLILLSVMVMFGGGANSMLMGYALILIMLPLAQVGFIVAIKSSTPEA
ncbi:MAG TPA: type II secretion system F family protein [Candidatus Thermoplasmatota archaeon]|nr:type II secretion system F family protein [Candidatus Thermoplasmatota archaeon]